VETERILELFDAHLRRDVVDADGIFAGDGWSAVLWPPADVEKAVERLRALPGHVEWKYYSHDAPPDLPDRLVALGLVPEEEETVLVAEADSIPPPGVETVLSTDAFVELAARIFGRRAELPDGSLAVVVEEDGEVVSGGRVDLDPQGFFAGLYGGVTLPGHRGRGLYRATVARRAELARERGYRYLYVDALPTSRPILERLGFVAITTTRPYTFSRRPDESAG